MTQKSQIRYLDLVHCVLKGLGLGMTSKAKTRPKETAEPADQQPMRVDQEEQATIEIFEPERFESFSALEGALLREATGQVNCLGCNVKELRNKGPGGAPNQGGFRLIQVQCDRSKGGCGTSTRLSKVLEGCPELLAIHQQGLKYFLRKGLEDKKRAPALRSWYKTSPLKLPGNIRRQ